MERRQPRRRPWASLVIALLFFAIGATVLLLAPPAINTSHVSHSITPGAISLPPTAIPHR